MTVALALGGPVSVALEAEVRSLVRQHGVVVWLDPGAVFSGFVDQLRQAREAEAISYRVTSFRGSYLELMLELEEVATSPTPKRLLLHLPGLNQQSVLTTPLLELYRAGRRHERALPTLVVQAAEGRVKPQQVEAFLQQPELTLEQADEWLRGILEDTTGGLRPQLRAMDVRAVLDDLLENKYVAQRMKFADDQAVLWDQAEAWTGLTAAWRVATLPREPRPADMAFTLASWALCVEYVDDLTRDPVNELLAGVSGLPGETRERCKGLAAHLRERQPGVYLRTADDAESLLTDEVQAARAEDLGKIDTFRFEEQKVLVAALQALEDRGWDRAVQYASERFAGRSFWLHRDPHRLSAWRLIEGAGRLGQQIEQAGTELAQVLGLEEALERYAELGSQVDRAHRLSEQLRTTLLVPQVPEFERLRACLDELRLAWRAWADVRARDFNQVCREHGFLPSSTQQQRTVFDQVVRPLTQESGTTALFVIDAFRYEMGQELYEALESTPASTVSLEPRLAELPTVTEVGMNVLAPVAVNGRLSPAVRDGRVLGFSTGEFRVCDPETRKRAMRARVGGGSCPWLTLDEVMERDATNLRRAVSKANLVVVHSREIDDAGEKGHGPAMFDLILQKLQAAWRLLRDAGVKRFVFTSDHGFLLLDDASALAQAHGRKIDPKRRHVLTLVAADHRDEARVSLADLGYEGAEGFVCFPESTAVFDTGRRATGFVHGGNSLQERVIPVLTVIHRSAAGKNTIKYTLSAAAKQGLMGMHCLQVSLDLAESQQGLMFGGDKQVDIGLRVLDPEGVRVDLVQARGADAEVTGKAIRAPVGEAFEVFFRLSGSTDTRALVEVYHPSAQVDVEPAIPASRFAVSSTGVARGSQPEPEAVAQAAEGSTSDWLERLPEGGVRKVFRHLAEHGAVPEADAVKLLGSQRKLRKFSLHFKKYASMAPFEVRIEVVGGRKSYMREGGTT